MSSITIKYSDIPTFLHDSEFYRSLSIDDPQGTICVPSDCFIQSDQNATDINSVCSMLRVTIFWVLDAIPLGVLVFCSVNDVQVWQSAVGALPGATESRILPDLLAAYSNNVDQSFIAVVKTGRWELIDHAVGRLAKDGSATAAAAEAGNVRVLRHLVENGFIWHHDTCVKASEFGHLECLEFAHQNGCPWTEEGSDRPDLVCTYAAGGGHLQCLQYAHQQGAPWSTRTTAGAAAADELDCLRYALDHGCQSGPKIGYVAAQHGRIESLKLLRDYGIEWDNITIQAAASRADVDCLRFLHESGCPWDGLTPKAAAKAGSVCSLRYALDHGCPHSHTPVYAARVSSLECLVFLVEERHFPLSAGVFIVALLKGNLRCLQYLLDHGCPFIHAKFSNVAADVVRYHKSFVKNNPEFPVCVMYAMERGWVPNEHFTTYIVRRDLTNCAALLNRGWHVVAQDAVSRRSSVANLVVSPVAAAITAVSVNPVVYTADVELGNAHAVASAALPVLPAQSSVNYRPIPLDDEVVVYGRPRGELALYLTALCLIVLIVLAGLGLFNPR